MASLVIEILQVSAVAVACSSGLRQTPGVAVALLSVRTPCRNLTHRSSQGAVHVRVQVHLAAPRGALQGQHVCCYCQLTHHHEGD